MAQSDSASTPAPDPHVNRCEKCRAEVVRREEEARRLAADQAAGLVYDGGTGLGRGC